MTANGPYIITTKRMHAITAAPGCDDLIATSRRAVATLEEARGYVRGVVVDQDTLVQSTVLLTALIHQADRLLTEAGGTVGPLPDGTVIEVEESNLDAYNARQEADRAR